MPRKQTHPQEQDHKEINSAFLLKFAKLNYEGKTLNIEMLTMFTNFIKYLNDNLMQKQELINNQTIKAMIDIAITVQFNLHMNEDFMSSTFDIAPIINFLEALLNFTDKIFLLEQKPNNQNITQVLDVFWPLLSSDKEIQKVQVKQFDKIASALQKINNLPCIYEIEPFVGRISAESVIKECVQISYLQQDLQFSTLFRSVLSKYNETNRVFIESLLSYLQSLMNQPKDNKSLFEKCLNLLVNISNCIGEKYNYIEIFFNRLISSKFPLRNFTYAMKCMQKGIGVEKYYSSQNLLTLSFIIVQKIVNEKSIKKQSAKALQVIAALSNHWVDVNRQYLKMNDLTQKVSSDLIFKLIKIFIPVENFKNQPNPAMLLQNTLIQAEKALFQSGELDSKKIFQFFKQCQMRSDSQQNDQWIQNSNQTQFGKKDQQKTQLYIEFIRNCCTFIQNLSQINSLKQNLKLRSIKKLQQTLNEVFTKQVQTQNKNKPIFNEISSFITKIFPTLIPDDQNENLLKKCLHAQNKISQDGKISGKNQRITEVLQALLVKKLQQSQNYSKLKHDFVFQDFIDQVFALKGTKNQQILNFHFIIFYILIKKCSSLPQKEEITELQQISLCLINKMNEFVEQHQKMIENKESQGLQRLKKNLLILEFFLILILDHPSSSFKLSLKKIFTQQNSKITNNLDLHELIVINQKQTANSFFISKAKHILGFTQQNQSAISKMYLNLVQKQNAISFPENYLRLDTESKEEKKMKIFLNIKLNNISLSLKKTHKVPQLINNINLMRKVNSINSLEILLYSFCEYFDNLINNQHAQEGPKISQPSLKKQYVLKISQSQLIVGFNYLLKIDALIGKFNENANQEGQGNVTQKIFALQDIRSEIQQTLEKIQHLVMEQNRTFDLKILIKILQNIRESTNLAEGIVEKYINLLNEGQMIKLISQLTEDSEKLRIQFSQLALLTMKKLISKNQKINDKIKQLQKIKLQQRNTQQNHQNQLNEMIEEEKSQQMKDLSFQLKQLYLMYYPYKHDLNLANMLRIKTEVSILQLLDDAQQIANSKKQNIETLSNSIAEDLMKNIALVRQIILKENQQVSTQNSEQLIWNFKYASESKFISFIVKSILKMFSSPSQKDKTKITDKIFSISSEVLDNEHVCQLARKQIGNNLNQQFITMISGRIQQGCGMIRRKSQSISPRKTKKNPVQLLQAENKKVKDFHSTSVKLYNIIKKVIDLESINSQEIVNSLIQKDNLDSIEVTKFLLTELINVSTFIMHKSQSLTETIFSYVIRANESYHAGKSQLQIPQFLCEFFDISHADNLKNQLQAIQKSQRSTNACSANISYRCLKCDDKRIMCYSCVVECHKAHPVIYLSEQRYPKCQCKEIGVDTCKIVKKGDQAKISKPQPFKSMFSYESKEPLRGGRHQFFMMEDDRMFEPPLNVYDEEQFRDTYRFGTRIRNVRQFEPMGGRMPRENIFAMDPLDRQQSFLSQHLVRQQKKIQGSSEKIVAEENFDFEDQNYELKPQSMEVQEVSKQSKPSPIQSQSYLLPVFLQMFNDIYTNNQEVSTRKISSHNQRFGFTTLNNSKIIHSSWRATSAGTYPIRLKKQNPLNNKSPAVSKQIIAQNHKYILVSSGSMIFVHSKQKYLMNLLDGKQTQSLPNVNQFACNFDVHTIDFSPLDDSVLVISGLHNILMLSISIDGIISKVTHQQRVSVNNDYINKVRTSSLGVFYSTSYEIKLLNWTFKPVLSIKSSSDCLLKEWCLYEKTSGCTVYCVTTQGFAEYIDINASDEGKKVFTNKVVDGRKVFQTGASILVKDVQNIGKVYLASYKDKDGSNIIGNLQGDTVQNTSNFLLRNNFVNFFDKKYLIGQADIIKGSENQIFIICTIRQNLTPQNSIGQGHLTVFHIRKDKKCQFQLINPDNKCQNFAVVPVGESNWSIISIHDDGSLHFSILQKPLKQSIDQQCKKLRQYQPASQQKNTEKYSQLKQTIKKIITQETLSEIQLHPMNYFREFSENLKNNNDYKMVKKNQEYEITLVNNNKVITGFTLPFIGNVYLPNRTVKNTAQVGLSNLQILHYFGEGCLKFRVQKIQDYKSGMQNLNQKFKQKFERLGRLNQIAMDSERAMHILNTIKQVESVGSDQVQFYGQSFDVFKNKIINFGQIFSESSSQLSNDKKVQKMAILLQIFITDSIKNQNYLCQPQEILEFVKNLRKISLGITEPQIYKIIKNLIVSALKMYEAQMGIISHVFNDQFYPLKYATQQKANYCYELLKGQCNDNQVEESINFWNQICNQDLSLGLLYLSKYPSLLAKIHKKSKKIDKPEIRQKLMKLYVLGYQVLKFKQHNCEWLLGGICSLFTGQSKNKHLREVFYQILIKYENIELQAWLKNVQQIDGQQNVSNVNLIPKVPQVQEPSLIAEDNMAALYRQFDMGEMDDQAMMEMAIKMSEMQMRMNEQKILNLNNSGNMIEQQKDNLEDNVMQMQNETTQKQNPSKRTLLKDLVQHCTSNLNEPSEIVATNIIVLYVISKYVNKTENIPVFIEILQNITRILADLTPNCSNVDKHILMAYLSVFSNILSTSKIIKNNLSETASNLYLVIKEEVINRLQNVKPQKVSKLKNPPNLLGKIFRGQKIYTLAHYAYGLVSLLLPPCEPLPILLSLECYWVLPESKQFYTKLKHMTTIKQGINIGDINKVYDVATKDAQVWRQIADIVWLQDYIENKSLNWEKALELLALYYENEQTPQ